MGHTDASEGPLTATVFRKNDRKSKKCRLKNEGSENDGEEWNLKMSAIKEAVTKATHPQY